MGINMYMRVFTEIIVSIFRICWNIRKVFIEEKNIYIKNVDILKKLIITYYYFLIKV